jgi:23S rRNA pseudouridine1911/1915/1917 synthase
MTDSIDILYEDNHLLAIYKPGGLLVQGDRTGDRTALELARAYVKEAYNKPGKVFMGLVHRIDRPVSGVVLLARTSKAASRLARAFHDRRVEKTYLAVVTGSMADDGGDLVDYIERDGPTSRLAAEPSATAKESVLAYRVLDRRGGTALLEVIPRSGRHHQIRVQLGGAGHPVVGDLRYGAKRPLPDRTIALHSARLALDHPVRNEPIMFAAPPPLDAPPWVEYRETIQRYFG